MKYNIYSEVALAKDLPQYSLFIGDIGTIVEYYKPNIQISEPGYSLEIFDALGDTLNVITVPESYLQPLKHSAVLNMRELQTA